MMASRYHSGRRKLFDKDETSGPKRSIGRGLLGALLFSQVLTACSLEGKIYSLDTLSELLPPGSTTPRLKTSSLPISVPEGYPYKGTVQAENISGPIVYSLVDNTCANLTIDSATGILSGLLNHSETESCSYKIKALTNGSDEYLSETVALNFTSPLTLSFSVNQLLLPKDGSSKVVSLSVSPAPPFDSDIEYELFSTDGGTPNHITGYTTRGTVSLTAGQANRDLTLQVPATAGFTGTRYQVLALQTGSTTSKPKLDLSLSENLPLQFDMVAAGSRHTCAIKTGKLYCWGSNSNGQVGLGAASPDVEVPTRIGSSTTWEMVAVGQVNSCGIDAGKLYCWGNDDYGQVGNEATVGNIMAPAPVGLPSQWEYVTVGLNHSCGINAGQLYCWGRDNSGQVGNGATVGDILTPTLIDGSTTWEKVAAGSYHTCGIKASELYCWGQDAYGQVGNGAATITNVTSPAPIGSSNKWSDIGTGVAFTCGIDDGKLYCWGRDKYGQIGNGTTTGNISEPAQITISSSWQTIAVGGFHVCGIDGGKLYCWGLDSSAQLGNGPVNLDVDAPVQIGSSSLWQAVSAGHYHTCGIDGGKFYCWGWDGDGQLGNGSATGTLKTPTPFGGTNNWQVISAGANHTCGIEEGKLFCWGSDSNGQVGNGPATGSVSIPTRIGTSSSWQAVSAGFAHTCGIDDGKLYCWGRDTNGEMGNGPLTGDVSSPTRIGTSTTWQAVAVGTYHSCGIDDGKLYCWGNNSVGQIGHGLSGGIVAAPVQESRNSTTWESVTIGAFHTCGIDGGRLYCWGSDTNGQLGNGAPAVALPDPSPVGGSDKWQAVDAGAHHTCGIDDGKLYCWGHHWHGQLGNGGAAVDVLAPVTPVSPSTAWTAITANETHTCGIDGGRLYCWGNTEGGKVGNGVTSLSDVVTPYLVGASTTWSTISAGNFHNCGLNAGALLCFGIRDSDTGLAQDTSIPTPLYELSE